MIFRGPESLEYPSRKEFHHLAEIMDRIRAVNRREQLPELTALVNSLVPHQYSASGIFQVQEKGFAIGYSNYGAEHTHLYQAQGYKYDPAIHLLSQTRLGTVSSEDCLDIQIPKEITDLKQDSGIRECLTVGVRGLLGKCTYFAFSNFDSKLLAKFRTLMQILGPHLHLAYMNATSWTGPGGPSEGRMALTEREEEIMRWVAEGKTNWEISIILRVSLNTIKFHLKNVYQKLGGVENRWAAVAQWQSGLLAQQNLAEENKTSPDLSSHPTSSQPKPRPAHT